MLLKREHNIINLLKGGQQLSSNEIYDKISDGISYSSVKRSLVKLVDRNLVNVVGRGRGTKYRLSQSFEIVSPINIETYFSKEIDEREIKGVFDFTIISKLRSIELFTNDEIIELNSLHNQFKNNISELTQVEYKKELERLAIDLSWKSSQIEGNTYSLLETELLLKEKETASGKTKEEAIMLLNHKVAIDFIVENPDYLVPLTLSKIKDIHSLLINELGVEKNLRKRRVGISGTNYRPLDNEFKIAEAMTDMCKLVNSKENIFEKALLVLVLISYIQPFIDGNKRTARIISNAILLHFGYCPLSFRTVDSIEYKKSMLIFYEQNNIMPCKEMFIEQFKFAVNSYF